MADHLGGQLRAVVDGLRERADDVLYGPDDEQKIRQLISVEFRNLADILERE